MIVEIQDITVSVMVAALNRHISQLKTEASQSAPCVSVVKMLKGWARGYAEAMAVAGLISRAEWEGYILMIDNAEQGK